MLKTRTGAEIPIKRVRIRVVQEKVESIGKGPRARFVIPGSNHHAEILAEMNPKGEITRYRGEAVSLLEASERKRQGVPVVKRDAGPGLHFVCTLSEGDLIEACKPGEHAPTIWRVRSVRQSGQLALSRTNDARQKKETDLWQPSVATVFSCGARKVLVTHLGELIPAND